MTFRVLSIRQDGPDYITEILVGDQWYKGRGDTALTSLQAARMNQRLAIPFAQQTAVRWTKEAPPVVVRGIDLGDLGL